MNVHLPGDIHSWERDPIAFHCRHPRCTAATTDPGNVIATTYGWGARHNEECSCIRVNVLGDCLICGQPRGYPPSGVARK